MQRRLARGSCIRELARPVRSAGNRPRARAQSSEKRQLQERRAEQQPAHPRGRRWRRASKHSQPVRAQTGAEHSSQPARAPALSQMMVGIWRSARANACMARLRLPGVRSARSSTTRAICVETKGAGQPGMRWAEQRRELWEGRRVVHHARRLLSWRGAGASTAIVRPSPLPALLPALLPGRCTPPTGQQRPPASPPSRRRR